MNTAGAKNHRAKPGMRYPLAKEPEEDNIQDRSQEQAICESFDQHRGWSKPHNRRSHIDEPQQAKHEMRAASAPAYFPPDGKAALFRLN
jgi:hypothetical protein